MVQNSTLEEKTNWVLAKYRWYGFVEEIHIKTPRQLAEGIFEATIGGTAADVLWWISMKSEVNCTVEQYGLSTPLHMATKLGRCHVIAFLLLVYLHHYFVRYQTNLSFILLLTVKLHYRTVQICMLQMIRAIFRWM